MGYTIPDVSYNISITNLKFNTTEDVTVGSTCKVSYNHKISITLTPTNCSLSQFDIRATAAAEAWDIDQGKLLSRSTNLPHGSQYSCEFVINQENFPAPGDYRVGLYARNESDDSWDVTYLLFTLKDESFLATSDGLCLEVATTRSIP